MAHNTVTVTDGTGSATYAEGDTVTITANAAQSDYHFTGWTVVSGGVTLANATDSTTTFTMPDKVVEVKGNYAINIYTITAATGSSGAVSPQGNITVNHGDSKKFNFTANEGYHIKDVTVDGSSIGTATSYTFDNVTANHTISVTLLALSATKLRFSRFGKILWACPFFVPRTFTAANALQMKLFVHIFVNRGFA